jgi:hypothetical protein
MSFKAAFETKQQTNHPSTKGSKPAPAAAPASAAVPAPAAAPKPASPFKGRRRSSITRSAVAAKTKASMSFKAAFEAKQQANDPSTKGSKPAPAPSTLAPTKSSQPAPAVKSAPKGFASLFRSKPTAGGIIGKHGAKRRKSSMWTWMDNIGQQPIGKPSQAGRLAQQAVPKLAVGTTVPRTRRALDVRDLNKSMQQRKAVEASAARQAQKAKQMSSGGSFGISQSLPPPSSSNLKASSAPALKPKSTAVGSNAASTSALFDANNRGSAGQKPASTKSKAFSFFSRKKQ